MLLLEALVVLALAATSAAMGWGLLRLLRTEVKLERSLLRSEAQRSESVYAQQARVQLEQAHDLAETAVAGVRAVHQGIAAIPFGLLEAIPTTAPATQVVRVIHDGIADTIYDGITGGNRLLGRILWGAGRTPPGEQAAPPSHKGKGNKGE